MSYKLCFQEWPFFLLTVLCTRDMFLLASDSTVNHFSHYTHLTLTGEGTTISEPESVTVVPNNPVLDLDGNE